MSRGIYPISLYRLHLNKKAHIRLASYANPYITYRAPEGTPSEFSLAEWLALLLRDKRPYLTD